MAKMLIVAALFAVSTSALSVSGGFLRNVHVHSRPNYKMQCGLSSGLRVVRGAAALLQHEVEEENPGAGMSKSAIRPFEKVLKDGFMKVDCLKDEMYLKGDKHGKNRYDYNQGKISGVSIIHYDDFIAKLDRKPMTHDVCFEFCRTVPGMGAFGIMNGRNCYCTPYYKKVASGSSMCDAPCDGDHNLMCGGKEKSTVFVMHLCNDAKGEVDALLAKGATQKASFDTKYSKIAQLNASILSEVAFFEPLFAQVGDVVAATQCQTSTAFAVELQRALQAADKAAATEYTAKVAQAATLSAEGVSAFTDPVKLKKAEVLQADITKLLATLAVHEAKFDKLIALAENAVDNVGAAAQYRSAMYFADKKYETAPSTCSGKAVGKPIMAKNEDSCASACDAQIQSCTAFQYFKHANQTNATNALLVEQLSRAYELFGQTDPDNTANATVQEPGLCFLFSELKTINYYTGHYCASPLKPIDSSIPMGFTCFAKLSKFQGTSVAKLAKKSDRCFEAAAPAPAPAPASGR